LTIIKGTRFVESRAGNSQIVGRPIRSKAKLYQSKILWRIGAV
jgi:hypothetical protein